ncbi:uncharacterized protein [Musca autumnalis]|uniref:uncharacterized protein n=1 Tax=Musca autumnalis TaxID=221902 RepID=UPI003CEA5632
MDMTNYVSEECPNKENNAPNKNKRLGGPKKYVREPWWCEEAAQLHNAIKEAKHRYFKTRTLEDLRACVRAEDAFNDCIKELKFEWKQKKLNRKQNDAEIVPDERYVSKPWWCEETAQLFKFKEEAKRKHFKSGSLEDLKAYKQAGDTFHARLRELKWEWKQKQRIETQYSVSKVQTTNSNKEECQHDELQQGNATNKHPKQTSKNDFVPKPWWCDEATRLLMQRNEARHQYERTNNWENAMAYLKAEDEFKKYLRKKKREWQKLEKEELEELQNNIEKKNISSENILKDDTSQNRIEPKAWWDEEAARLVEQRNEARSKYFKTNKPKELKAYQEAEDAFKTYINKLKWDWKQKQKNENQQNVNKI